MRTLPSHAAQASWVQQHPFLDPVARVEDAVAAVLADEPVPRLSAPKWESYRDAFRAGVPLLRHGDFAREAAAITHEVLERLVEQLAAADIAPALAEACDALAAQFEADPGAAERALLWVMQGREDDEAPLHAGTVRFLAWAVLRQQLAPVLDQFEGWRRGGLWTHGLCPTCGARPTMAQLQELNGLRHRYLSCGCCHTTWKHKRIGCPHCGNESQERLDRYEIEGEKELAIAACQACGGYVKTWSGNGDPAVYLSDWTTLHLDVLAANQGLQRFGASLYTLD